MQPKSCTIAFFLFIFATKYNVYMKFVRIIPEYNHLWAVRDDEEETDALSLLFRRWSNFNYLLDFFFANLDDLQGLFHVEKVSDAIRDTMEDAQELERLILDFPYTEQ